MTNNATFHSQAGQHTISAVTFWLNLHHLDETFYWNFQSLWAIVIVARGLQKKKILYSLQGGQASSSFKVLTKVLKIELNLFSLFQLFVYIFNCLFTCSAVCLHVQLFAYIFKLFVYIFKLFVYIFSCLFTFLTVCLHSQIFVYMLSCLLVIWIFAPKFFKIRILMHCGWYRKSFAMLIQKSYEKNEKKIVLQLCKEVA